MTPGVITIQVLGISANSWPTWRLSRLRRLAAKCWPDCGGLVDPPPVWWIYRHNRGQHVGHDLVWAGDITGLALPASNMPVADQPLRGWQCGLRPHWPPPAGGPDSGRR